MYNMKQTFGDFVREKRKARMLRLNAFADSVGISTVYASYIENNKRPAPSQRVIQEMERVLELNGADSEQLYALAMQSRYRHCVPQEILTYISENDYVLDALRTACERGADEQDWQRFVKSVMKKTL